MVSCSYILIHIRLYAICSSREGVGSLARWGTSLQHDVVSMEACQLEMELENKQGKVFFPAGVRLD
jgi:hypothetical protein